MIKLLLFVVEFFSDFHMLPPLKKDNANTLMTKNVPDHNVSSVNAIESMESNEHFS